MAKQIGIIKLKGKIGDLSFYKTKDGHLILFQPLKNSDEFILINL